MKKYYYIAEDRGAAPHVNFNRYDVDSFLVTEEGAVISSFCKSSKSLRGCYSPAVKVGETLPTSYFDYEVPEEEFMGIVASWML